MEKRNDLDLFIKQQLAPDSFDGLPLAGTRIIDMATVMAAPYAATLLGDYGAEVIKIENPANPDAIRTWGVVEEKGIHPFWAVFGRNKFPVTLNLKTPAAKDLFIELIQTADVLIENMRPGVMKKLGIGTDELLQINPGLIIGTVSGYGQSGPYAGRPGFGTLAEGFSGFTYLNAQPDGPPTNAPLALADFITGVHLAVAVLIALRKQKRGESGGQQIDISLYEPLFSLLGADFLTHCLTAEIPQPKGNELSYVVPRNNYRTRDGRWVTLSGASQKPFERLMESVGHPEMNADPRFKSNQERVKEPNRRVINQVISEWIGQRDLNDVIATCERLGITVGPIAHMGDIAADPQFNERGSILSIEDPVTGEMLKLPNLPFRLLGSPGQIRFPGLPVGSANDAVFGTLLGYSRDRIAEFRENSII